MQSRMASKGWHASENVTLHIFGVRRPARSARLHIRDGRLIDSSPKSVKSTWHSLFTRVLNITGDYQQRVLNAVTCRT